MADEQKTMGPEERAAPAVPKDSPGKAVETPESPAKDSPSKESPAKTPPVKESSVKESQEKEASAPTSTVRKSPITDAPDKKPSVKNLPLDALGKVVDIHTKATASKSLGDERKGGISDNRPPREKTSAELEAEEAAQKPRRGRPPKTDKAAPDKAAAPRDTLSRGNKKKPDSAKPAPEQAAPEPPAAPTVTEPEKPSTPPRPVEKGKIVYLKLSELHPFHTFGSHPFSVEKNARFAETAASIKENGVWTPATVRPEKDGNGYEIIAGHCRHRASELAGLEDLPCIIREMDDEQAFREMRDSNKQRGEPLPSERARLLAMEVELIKHQGGRMKGVAPGDIGKRSVEIVGENNDMNYKKVMRYIRLNSLVPELLNMVDGVDGKKLGFMTAVELSYIKPKNQRLIAVSIEGEEVNPSTTQAKKLRELDQKNKLTGDIIDGILSEVKKEVDDKVIITTKELSKYFGEDTLPGDMKAQIIALLDEWKAKQPPEKSAPVKAPERG